MQVALSAGLSTDEAARRREVFGPNQLKGRKPVHPVVLFLKHLINVMTVILFIALGLSLAVHEWIEASVIAFVIILNAVVGFVQEYGSEKTMQVLRRALGSGFGGWGLGFGVRRLRLDDRLTLVNDSNFQSRRSAS